MDFEFATTNRIIFGPGAIRKIGDLAAGLGQVSLVVVGKDTARVSDALRDLHQAGLSTLIYQVVGEPSVKIVQEAVEFSRKNHIDLVIGIGGGSALDAGKAVAGLATNPLDVTDYLEVIGRGQPLTNQPLPYIAVPTTAGTGSEVTRNAVLGAPDQQVKVSLRSPFLLPRVALVDPELTISLPPDITAFTGMDALTQLIEPYVSKRANPLTDAICIKGMALAVQSLLRVYNNGRDAAARQDLSLASLFGGLALANAGLGAVHGFAGVLGGTYSAPHGAVCARLLPEVMQLNVRSLETRSPGGAALDRYIEVARILTGNRNASIKEGVDWVRSLCLKLEIPGLTEYGVKEEHFIEIVGKAKRASSMKGNPIDLTTGELSEILRMALI